MRSTGKDGEKDQREEQRRKLEEERRAARIRAGAAVLRSASESQIPSNAAPTTAPKRHSQPTAESQPKDQANASAGNASPERKNTARSPLPQQPQRPKNALSDATVTHRLSEAQNTNAGVQTKAPSAPKLSPQSPSNRSPADIPELSLSDSSVDEPQMSTLSVPSSTPKRAATPTQRQCTPEDFKIGRDIFFARIAHANRPNVQPLFTPGKPTQLTKKDLKIITNGIPELFYRYIPLHRIGKPDCLISHSDFRRWYDAGIIINSGALEVEAILGNDMNFDLRQLHALVILKDATRPLTDDNIARCLLIRNQCDAVLTSSPAEIKGILLENKQIPVHLDLNVTPNTYRALPGKISIYDIRTVRPGVDEQCLLLNCGDQGYISRRAEISWYDFVLHGKLQISQLFPPDCDSNETHFMEMMYALLLNCVRPVEFIKRHIKLSSPFSAVRDDLKSTYLASIQKHFDPHLFNTDILSRYPEFIFYFKHQCKELEKHEEIKKGQCDLGDIILHFVTEGINLGFQQDLVFKMIKQRIYEMQVKLSLCFNPSLVSNESKALTEAFPRVTCPPEFIMARIAVDSKCSDSTLLQSLSNTYGTQIDILRDEIICRCDSFRAALKGDILQNAMASLKIPPELKAGDSKEYIQKRLENIKQKTQSPNQDMLPFALQQLLTPHLYHFTQAQRASQSVSLSETLETIHKLFIKEIVSLEEIIFNLPEFKDYLIKQFQLYEQGHQGVIPQILQHLLVKSAELGISKEQCIQELDARLASIRFYITDQLEMQHQHTAAPAEGKATQSETTPAANVNKP